MCGGKGPSLALFIAISTCVPHSEYSVEYWLISRLVKKEDENIPNMDRARTVWIIRWSYDLSLYLRYSNIPLKGSAITNSTAIMGVNETFLANQDFKLQLVSTIFRTQPSLMQYSTGDKGGVLKDNFSHLDHWCFLHSLHHLPCERFGRLQPGIDEVARESRWSEINNIETTNKTKRQPNEWEKTLQMIYPIRG